MRLHGEVMGIKGVYMQGGVYTSETLIRSC